MVRLAVFGSVLLPFANLHIPPPSGILTELHAIDRDDDTNISSLFFSEKGEQLVACYLESHLVLDTFLCS